MPRSSGPTGLIGTCQVAFEKAQAVPERLADAAKNQAAVPGSRFARSGGDGLGWEDGGMPDAIPPVDLASLAGGGGHPGARWRLDGEDLQANLAGSARVIASSRTATTRSRCCWWSSQAGASWPLTARSTSWPRWSSLTCPRGRSERSRPSMGRWRTCRSTATGRRASRWVGTPSDAEIPNGQAAREASGLPIHPL